jgi:hypothetical protein
MNSLQDSTKRAARYNSSIAQLRTTAKIWPPNCKKLPEALFPVPLGLTPPRPCIPLIIRPTKLRFPRHVQLDNLFVVALILCTRDSHAAVQVWHQPKLLRDLKDPECSERCPEGLRLHCDLSRMVSRLSSHLLLRWKCAGRPNVSIEATTSQKERLVK